MSDLFIRRPVATALLMLAHTKLNRMNEQITTLTGQAYEIRQLIEYLIKDDKLRAQTDYPETR